MEEAGSLAASQLAYELKRIREKVPVRLDVEPVDEIPTFEVVARKILSKVPRRQTELVKQTIEAALPSLKTEVETEAVKAQFGMIPGGMTMRSSQRRELSARCYHYSLSHFRQRGLEDQLFISLADAMLELSSIRRGETSAEANGEHAQISGVPPVERLAPYQLPPSISLLVGRSENIRQLNELTDKVDVERTKTVVITAISGAGGIGKTALAVCWAHQISSKFPDGQLFANLHGYDFAQPTSPADTLEHFLRSLGVAPEQIPDDLEQRAALYRTALYGRRMLIVLDNASGAEQVRPLLPGAPECFVLITSRSNLAGLTTLHAAKRITIGRLSSDESLELLSRVIGRHRVDEETDAAMKLVDICDGLPLALVIVCDQVNSRPRASLRVLAEGLVSQETRFDRLQVPDDPSANVQNVFEWSYRSLSSKHAHLFRLLSLHAGPTFYAESAAALLGVNDVEVSTLLQDLCAYHLIEERSDAEFEFHDLLRDYARAVCKRDEPAEDAMLAIKRETAWYLTFALHGSQWIMPQRKELKLPEECKDIDSPLWSNYQAALEWCERERVNMLHAIQQAYEQQMYELAWKLPVALRGFYNLRKHWSDWLSTHEVGLNAAQRLGDIHAEGRMLNGLGTVCRQLGRTDEALNYHQQALEYRVEDGDLSGQGSALDSLGNVYRDLGQSQDAESCYKRSMALRLRIRDIHGQGWSLNNLGEIAAEEGDYVNAIRLFTRALEIRRQVEDSWGEGSTLHNIACAQRQIRAMPEASASFEGALKVRRSIGDRWGISRTLFEFSKLHHRAGRFDEERAYLQEAHEICEQLGDSFADRISAQLSVLS